MPWAAVPETTIDEHRYTLAPKHEIRVAMDGLLSAPTADARSPEDGGEPDFGLQIASGTYCGHYLGTLLLGENVCH